MLANQYKEEDISPQQWRVLDRIGARDGVGIQYALKKHRVNTIDELIHYLEHHQPRHEFRKRLRTSLGRLMGGYDYDPHAKQIKVAMREAHEELNHIKIMERLKEAKQNYDE